MNRFEYDKPSEGAEVMLKWAREAVACRRGLPLEEEIDESAITDFFDQVEFDGPLLRTALHFGFASIVAAEGGEKSSALWTFLDRSIGSHCELPRDRSSALMELIALGIALEPRTVTWLERGELMAADALRALWELVIESRRPEGIRALAGFLNTDAANDPLLADLASGCAFRGLGDVSLEILGWLAPDRIDDKSLSDFVRYQLDRLSPEQIDRFCELFQDRDISEVGCAWARARALMAAGRLVEAGPILDEVSPSDRWQFASVASERVIEDMENGRFEETLSLCERFGGHLSLKRSLVGTWIRQWLDHFDLDQAISMALRLSSEASRIELALALIERGEIEQVEAVARDGRSDLERAAILREMVKATRENSELRVRADRWLIDLEQTIEKFEVPESPRNEIRRLKVELDRQWRVEQWFRGEREPLEAWITETLAQREAIQASGEDDIDGYESAPLTAQLAAAFAESRQYDRLMPWLQPLSRVDRLDDLAEVIFENWVVESDCDEILRLCQDSEEYGKIQLLEFMAYRLAESGDRLHAEAIARHLREHFDEKRSFEQVADALRNRGDYEGARELGGASGRRRDPQFFPASDEEGCDWVTSVKEWNRSPEWLLHYGGFGRAREAVEGLVRMHFWYVLPRWLTEKSAEPDPNYPQDFEGICRRAEEEAVYRLWQEGRGPAPKESWDLKMIFWKMEAGSWLLDIFAATRINAMERKIERDLKRKEKRAGKKLAVAVPAAMAMQAGRARFETLCKLAEDVAHYDDLKAPEALSAGLRREAELLKQSDSVDSDQWSKLAQAMLRVEDAGGAAAAWTEFDKDCRLEESRIRDLADQAHREHWHEVAPLCRRSPLACAVLAAKLAKWFPKAGIRMR